MATLTHDYQKLNEKDYFVQNTRCKLRLYGKYNNTQSIEYNRTNVTFELRTLATNGSFYSSGNSSKLSCVVDRGTQWYDIGNVGSSEKSIGSWTFDLTHNNDGTYNGYVWAWADVFAGVEPTIDANFTLPKINRYAMITTANAFTDEENPSMTFTNNNLYNLRAKLKVGNEVIYSEDLANNTTTSYTFELTNAQRTRLRQLCTGQYLSTTFQIISLENNVEKYTSSKDAQMTIVNANPTFTYSVVETNAKVISALGSSSANSIIDNVSQVKISVTPTTYKEATMSRFWVKHDGKEYQDDTSPYEITIPITADRFSFDVVDSRGLSPTPTLLIKTLIEYEPLKINSYTFKRENPISSNVILNLDVLYYSSFGNVANVPVVKWKLADGSYTTIPSSYYTIDSTNHKLTISNYEISNILPYNQQGQFSIYIEDKLTIAEDTGANGLVLKGVATFEAGEHDLQVNGNLYIADINRENKVNVKDLHKVSIETDGSAVKTGRVIDGYEEYVKRISMTSIGSVGTHTKNLGFTLSDVLIIKIDGVAISNSNNWFALPMGDYNNATTWSIRYQLTNSTNTIDVTTANSNYTSAYFDIYYIIE